MHSHHSHSGQFCRHAKDDLEAVVKKAIEVGFTTFGLSEHAPRYRPEDLFPEEVDLKPEDLESIYMEFLTTAADLKSKYQDQINLLIGIETDFVTPIDLQRTKALLDSRQDIQYVVGSVHHVAGVSIDFDKSTYIRSVEHCANGTMGSTMVSCSSSSSSSSSDPEWEMPAPRNPDHVPSDEELELFLTKYLDAQYEMIDALEPEVIGHFDLCLLFNPGYRLDGSGREVIWDKVKRNVRKVVEYGGLFEANGAALRKGWETSYPSKEVLQLIQKLILELKGRICLSDDSHGIAQVGLNYRKMRDYLSNMGVEEIWHLVDSKDRQEGDERVGSRGRVFARQVRNWGSDSFWERCP